MTAFRGWALAACLALIPLAPGTADAAPRANKADKGTAAAKLHFTEAKRLYFQARYREAILEYQAAYRAKPAGELHFNIAQCYERLDELPAALKSYETYLLEVPQAEDRMMVLSTMRTLHEKLAARKAAASAPVVTAPPPPPAPVVSAPAKTSAPSAALSVPGGDGPKVERPRIWTWVALGAGVAAAAGGMAMGLQAQSQSNTLIGSQHSGEEATRLRNAARSNAGTANILYGVAGGLGAVGVTLFFVEGQF